ncbi:hypothetical protein, partial [Tateyamaria pelophila]|uniref:hypothetical protein n=1 Tax=Tateyamaria pelophila TaxID=328415 RepID=UPI001CBC99DD
DLLLLINANATKIPNNQKDGPHRRNTDFETIRSNDWITLQAGGHYQSVTLLPPRPINVRPGWVFSPPSS